jgi:hypothetical protein
MAHFAEMVYHLGGVPVGDGLGTIALGGGQVFFVDSELGLDGNDGKSASHAKKTFEEAYKLMTTNKNDIMVLIGRATGYALAAVVDIQKSYCHFVGASPPLGIGQRVRITGSSTADLGIMFTVTGNGNSFHNIQFFNGSDAAQTTGAVYMTGDRNYFANCYIVGIASTDPAAAAGSYDLSLSGAAEFEFNNCTIGGETIARGAANFTMKMATSYGTFRNCKFRKWDETSSRPMIQYSSAGGTSWETYFIDSIFHNFSMDNANACTNVFDIVANPSSYWIILKDCFMVNCSGWGGDSGGTGEDRIYMNMTAPSTTTGGIGIKVAS